VSLLLIYPLPRMSTPVISLSRIYYSTLSFSVVGSLYTLSVDKEREKLNLHSTFDERALFSCNLLHFHTLTVVFSPVHPRFLPTRVHPYTLTFVIS
jgi:hypothetical protein